MIAMGARNSYPLVLDGNEQFQLTVSSNEYFRLTLMGPERMGALEVDGLQQRCALITTPCVLTLLPGTPNATLDIKAATLSTVLRMQTSKPHGFTDMTADGAVNLILRPNIAGASIDLTASPLLAGMTMHTHTAFGEEYMIDVPNGVSMILSASNLHGSANMMATGSTNIALSPVNARAHLDVPGAPKSASLLIGSDVLETLIIVGTPDGIVLILSPLSASASGNAFAAGASELHIRPNNPSVCMTAPGAGSASMTLGSSGRAAQTVSSIGKRTVMNLGSARAGAILVSPIYVGTDIDVPMSHFMDDTMADFMLTEVV